MKNSNNEIFNATFGNTVLGDVCCDASVRYTWGNYTKLERSCKNKAKHLIIARMKHNGHIFSRKVCSAHKNQIVKQQKCDGYSSEITSIENIA